MDPWPHRCVSVCGFEVLLRTYDAHTVTSHRYGGHCIILSLKTIDPTLSSTSVFGYMVVNAFVNELFTLVVVVGER